MRQKGKHFAGRQKTKKSSRSDFNTREYSMLPPRSPKGSRSASYFLFTLFACLLPAVFAAAVLCVDYFGRAVSEGAELTFAFNVSEGGEAVLSLLGREYSADISFITAAADRISNVVKASKQLVPKSIGMMLSVLPKLYSSAVGTVTAAVKLLISLF